MIDALATAALLPNGQPLARPATVPSQTFSQTLAAARSAGTPAHGMSLDQTPILLPTPENVRLLADKAAALLNSKLAAAGIPAQPGFSVQSTGNPLRLQLAGERQDAAAIEALLNDDPALSLAMHNVAGMASHLPAMRQVAAFTDAWQQCQNDRERQALWQYHTAVMASLRCDIRLEYNAGKVGVVVNDEALTT